MEIKDKVIIVTGASQGIGLATARQLGSEGAKVVLAARSKDTLRTLEAEIPNSVAIPMDFMDPQEITHLIQEAMEKFGRIDVLINNAGRGMYGPVESINLEDYKMVMTLNVYGPLLAMQAVIPIMRVQGGGMILNVSSRVSKNYFPNLAAYASTKYALNAISLTARAELAKDNIIVSVMHPKMTATHFGKNAIGMHPDFSAQPTRPAGTEVDPPEAVAEAIIRLIRSEKAEAEM